MVDPEKNKNYSPIKPNRTMKALLKKFGISEKELKNINNYMQTSILAIDAMSESLALYSGIKLDKETGKITYSEENDRANYYKAMNTLLEQNEKILERLETLNNEILETLESINAKLDKLVNNL